MIRTPRTRQVIGWIFAMTAVAACASGAAAPLKPPSQSTDVVLPYAVSEVRRAAEDALVAAGFEVQNRQALYVDGERPRRVGVFIGSGGERAGIWLEAIEEDRTRIRVRTARTFVGGAGQRNWDDVLLSEIDRSLARPK